MTCYRSMRAKMVKSICDAQNTICAAVAELDGTQFHEDSWQRDGFGGGITRVLQVRHRRLPRKAPVCLDAALVYCNVQGGNVWEKAGVNVSVVYGRMPAEAYYTAIGHKPAGPIPEDAGMVPFFAAGISSVMHPWNPKVGLSYCVVD